MSAHVSAACLLMFAPFLIACNREPAADMTASMQMRPPAERSAPRAVEEPPAGNALYRARRPILASSRTLQPITEEEQAAAEERERQIRAQMMRQADSQDPAPQDPAVAPGAGTQDPAAGGESSDPAAPAPEPVYVSVAEGFLRLPVPAGWKQVPPAVNMIEAEFAIPGETEEAPRGRATVMGSGGSIDANIERWFGQFVQPDGSDSSEHGSVAEKEISGLPVHIVDIRGTYMDGMGGPGAPRTERPGYRMLAAIIETPDHGNYFIKFYGPEPLVTAHQDGFRQMIEGIRQGE